MVAWNYNTSVFEPRFENDQIMEIQNKENFLERIRKNNHQSLCPQGLLPETLSVQIGRKKLKGKENTIEGIIMRKRKDEIVRSSDKTENKRSLHGEKAENTSNEIQRLNKFSKIQHKMERHQADKLFYQKRQKQLTQKLSLPKIDICPKEKLQTIHHEHRGGNSFHKKAKQEMLEQKKYSIHCLNDITATAKRRGTEKLKKISGRPSILDLAVDLFKNRCKEQIPPFRGEFRQFKSRIERKSDNLKNSSSQQQKKQTAIRNSVPKKLLKKCIIGND